MMGFHAPIKDRCHIKNPYCDDGKRPSFCAWDTPEGWLWKDYRNGDGGDVIAFHQAATGSERRQSINAIWEMIYGNEKPAKIEPRKIEHVKKRIAPTQLDWQERVGKVTDAHLIELAEWRGYSLEFCHWLRDKRLIGKYAGCWCFPIFNNGQCVRFHVRFDAGWAYKPQGVASRLTPMVIGSTGVTVISESQWDLFAMMQCVDAATRKAHTWIATRGASNTRIPHREGNTVILQQNDKAGSEWAKKIQASIGGWIAQPQGDDFNAWLKADFESTNLFAIKLLT